MRRTGAQHVDQFTPFAVPSRGPAEASGRVANEASAGPPLVIGSYPILCRAGNALGALTRKVIDMKRTLLGTFVGALSGCVLYACAACAGVALAGCDHEHHVRRAAEKLLPCAKLQIDDLDWPEGARR